MDMKELIKENEKLKQEIFRLRKLLDDNNISYEEKNNKSNLTTEEKVSIYFSYFRGRNDVYTSKYISSNGKKGYAKVCDNRFKTGICDLTKYKGCVGCQNYCCKPFSKEIVLKHLRGITSYGIYPIVDEDKCYFLAVDFDDEFFKHNAVSYQEECNKIGIDSIIELSQSGAGAHVWIFFDEPVSTSKVRKLGDYLLSNAINNNPSISFKSFDRFFPSQDVICKGNYGNCIALPLFGKAAIEGKSVFVDINFVKYDKQFEVLSKIKKISKMELDIIIEQLAISSSPLELNIKSIKKINLMKADFKSNLEIILDDNIYINKNDLSNKGLVAIRRLAAIFNPEFFERQAKRMSLYNVNRILELYQEQEEYIILPMGVIDDLLYVLNFYDITYRINDKRVKCKKKDISFNGNLYEYQEEAVKELKKFERGLLIAKPGTGKTIMGMSIIGELKKPTLVLVEKVELLKQWKDRIKQFMNFDAGVYYGAKKKLTNIIDIASIKSIKEDDTLFDKYEIIIGDEIHHIASSTYETTIRKFKARYVYGFTATPERSDHLEKIVYKVVGPIRYKLKEQKEELTKVLKPRFTRMKDNTLFSTINFAELENEIFKSDERNDQIVDDIMKEYKKKKNILVLTKRVEHIDILKNKLNGQIGNLFAISGQSKTREKRLFKEAIQNIASNYVLISTISYLGEGFDLPSLDTLFLTMPFKWKNTLLQSIGRIERVYDGKKDVVVYDYVDLKIGKLAHQFNLRLKEYKKEKYMIIDENERPQLLYSVTNYLSQLKEDLTNCNNAVFLINRYNEERLNALLKMNANIIIRTDENIETTLNIEKVHSDINCIIINDEIIWYGSINPFKYSKSEDSILRIVDLEYAKILRE